MVIRRFYIPICILLLTTAFSKARSQTFYINTKDGIFQSSGKFGSNKIRINDKCGANDTDILSIAVFKDTIYYNTWSGKLKKFTIGQPGSCMTLIENGFQFNSLTTDKNGMLYMANQMLAKYDPHKREFTNLGIMPFFSSGDMLFFQDKLLLSGWDPSDWSSGIFELNINDLSASKLYMTTPIFVGLLSMPVPCGNSRYFGLSAEENNTAVTEIDLIGKQVIGQAGLFSEKILDAASSTETGIDNKISINSLAITDPTNCANDNGIIHLSAFSPNGQVNYTLLNTGFERNSGYFNNLGSGAYLFRMEDAAGCTKDTSIVLTQNIPQGGCSDIFIPNAFTPNNDGKNDYFNITASASFKDIQLQIYGRWGNIVFASNGNSIAWDGKNNGALQPSGVYIYTISYTSPSGEKKYSKGTLTLIR